MPSSADPPPVPLLPPLIAITPRANGADVREDAGGPETALAVLSPPLALALRDNGRYGRGGGDDDSELEDVGVYKAITLT